MRFDRDTFGPYLRHARERRSIALDDIAARTKIARSLLAKLERGDLSDWPSGIFRRSFFREYVAAVGLDADALMDEFLRIFPDPASDTPAAPARGDMRLTLDAVPASQVSRADVRRALVDTVIIAIVAASISLAAGHAAIALAAVALVYHGLATALRGTTGGGLAAGGAVRAQGVEAALSHDARPRTDARRGEPARRAVRSRRRESSGVVRNFPQPS